MYNNRICQEKNIFFLIALITSLIINFCLNSYASETLPTNLQQILSRSKFEETSQGQSSEKTYTLFITYEDFLKITADESVALMRAAYKNINVRENVTVQILVLSIDPPPIQFLLDINAKEIPENYRFYFSQYQCGVKNAVERRPEIISKIRWMRDQAESLVQDYSKDISKTVLIDRATKVYEECDAFLEKIFYRDKCFAIFLKPESKLFYGYFAIISDFYYINPDGYFYLDIESKKEWLNELKKSPISELYTSPLGFSILLPSHYKIITGDLVKKSPDLFDFEGDDFKKMNESFKKQISGILTSGEVEFYYNLETINNYCFDGITATRDFFGLPKSGKELESRRKAMAKYLSEKMGVKVEFYKMELKTINNLQILYTEYGIQKRRLYYIQYAIKKSGKECIVLTAFFYEKNIERFKVELKYIIDSFKWN